MLQLLLMTKHQVASNESQHNEIRCADFLFCEVKKKIIKPFQQPIQFHFAP